MVPILLESLVLGEYVPLTYRGADLTNDVLPIRCLPESVNQGVAVRNGTHGCICGGAAFELGLNRVHELGDPPQHLIDKVRSDPGERGFVHLRTPRLVL